MFNRLARLDVRNIGHHTVESLYRLGYWTRFFALTLLHSGPSFARRG